MGRFFRFRPITNALGQVTDLKIPITPMATGSPLPIQWGGGGNAKFMCTLASHVTPGGTADHR